MTASDPNHDWSAALEAFLDPFAAPASGPDQDMGNSCLRRVIALLGRGSDDQRRLADKLASAELSLSVIDSDARSVNASVAVPAVHVADVRDGVADLQEELDTTLSPHGWQLRALQVVAADPDSPSSARPPKRVEVVEALAEGVSRWKKAYQVAAFCDRLDMPQHPDSSANPWNSKAVYVRTRLEAVEMPELMDIARRALDEFDSESLQELVARHRPAGPNGPVKNLVFGSTGKPDLVVDDALSNDLALRNPEVALIYDDGIPEEGLSWRMLVHGLLPEQAALDERNAARQLYRRLKMCLASRPEEHLFGAYGQRYKRLGFDHVLLLSS